MLINNIEYALRFWIDNEDEDTICNAEFESFEAMNRFLEGVWRSDTYDLCTAYFAPVKIINGTPDNIAKFIYTIAPVMPIEQTEIDDFLFEIKRDFKN